MSRRSRVLAYGSAALLVIAGGAFVAEFDGVASEAAAIALITVGLGAAVLLAFLEVGLSEDRERAAQEARRRERPKRRHDELRRPPLRRRPRRPG